MSRLNLKRKYSYTILSKNYGKALKGVKVFYRGFTEPPKIFKPEGMGFSGGKNILEVLSLKLKRFELVIVNNKKSRTRKRGKKYFVELSISDLRTLNSRKYAQAKDANLKTVNNFFAEMFPTYFSATDLLFAYQRGMFSDILKHLSPASLSRDDLDSLIDYLPKIFTYTAGNIRNASKLRADKYNYQVLYLDALLNEFEKKISRGGPESSWQKYLRENLLFLQENYIERIEKPNVSIGIRLPDFCLLTADDYLDVLEIKTPAMKILNPDKSHKNYYWSSAIAATISQVENYIDSINKNSDALRNYLRDAYGLNIRIVKPRGLIIAGSSKEFGAHAQKHDNFRLLNESLKNVTILTFDDVATRVRNSLYAMKQYTKKRTRSRRGKSLA